MNCANGHRLVDDGARQHGINSAPKLFVDGQDKTGRVAKLVCSTTCNFLDQFKRQVPDADGLKQHELGRDQEQRPKRPSVSASLSQLFAHINQPSRLITNENASKPSATYNSKCPWSVQRLKRSTSTSSQHDNGRNKLPLSHTLSAPGSRVMHHNDSDDIRTINDIQYEYNRQYITTTTSSGTDTSLPPSDTLTPSNKLGQFVPSSGTMAPVSEANEVTAIGTVDAIASDRGHRARVLKYNQREDSIRSEDGLVGSLLRSSMDSVSHPSAHQQAKLMLKLSLANKASSQARKLPPLRKVASFESDKDESTRDVDGGYAWVVLAVIFFINASTFGTARAYGLIFDKLARDDDKSRTDAAMPFTIMGAVENMAGPLSGYLLAKTNNSWRVTVFSGSCLITLAHLLAALLVDSHLGQLLSLGLMCGLGQSLVCISFFQLNNAYFVRYRSTAFGLGMTGAAFGTLYISLLCQYFLDNYGTSMCYLMLSLILLPNVPLSLLLKPKDELLTVLDGCKSSGGTSAEPIADTRVFNVHDRRATIERKTETKTISERVEEERKRNQMSNLGIWCSVKRVVCNPMFHLIWPTQLLFCWLNFVFGMIIVDFGRDRGLNSQDVSYLVPCWAFGQLVGRLFLSSLIDLKFLTYKSFTVICFCAISATTLSLNYIRLPTSIDDCQPDKQETFASQIFRTSYMHLIFLLLVFILSIFIALLFILFNGLVVNYVDTQLQPLSIGISSFTGSFFLLPRADVIGYYRDTTGNYDAMFTMFTYITLCAGLTWLIVPGLCSYVKRFYFDNVIKRQVSHNRTMDNMRVYSEWKLTSSIQSK